MRRRPSLRCLLLATLLALLVLAGCGLDEEAQAPIARSSLAIDGLYPGFDPDEPRYVSRCGRGAAPIHAEAGDGVEVQVDSGRPETGPSASTPA
ncbi:MAG TPA: hypothetical protein VFT10_05320 [Solirubrobacterales bacterium]|nr:hypothetical protein [Solirubrobacterales bacterium]